MTTQMAAESTSAHDPESLAWHHAQLGQLYLAWAYFQTGQIEKARTMMRLALRTGTRDRVIRALGAAIEGTASRSVRPPWAPEREAQRRQPDQQARR